MRGPIVLALALLAGSATLASAAAPAHPSLNGMWDYKGRVEAQKEVPPPPLTPAGAKLMAKKDAIRKGGFVRNVANILCLPTGVPQLMQWKSPLEIMEIPGRISIISEHDPGNDEPRTIYMNKALPKEPDPSWNGYSVGHWQGATLVVETAGFNDRGLLLQNVPRSASAKFAERFRLTDGGKTLIDEMTVTDPILTKPWVVAFRYERMPVDTERLEAVCEPDLIALKALDLESLKDTDVEANRLLDPSLQYNAGH
jgi:hypothetical protein